MMSAGPMERLAAALADRYRIERELGAGGMATVYLAHDVRHDRKVALKVLRPELAAILGGERFLAEIRTTANLQHPHILSLFDSGDADGLVFYVMPYVEGESLRDRLSRERQLPVDDAIRIAKEVADALQYAHEHGIVHRDIKPENILLHGGHAMVADFGIALAASRSEGGTRMTETGMSLGTPQYMAPEQAMGEREITPRADIYALGCVCYEMLTGEPPFTGPTAQAIFARAMTEHPRSMTLQRHTIPPHVEAVVWRALEKLPADRFASATAFIEALDRPGTIAMPAVAGSIATWSRGRRRLAVPAALVAIVAASALGGWWLARPAPPPVARYSIDIDHPSNGVPLFDLSADGSAFVFASSAADSNKLFVKYRGAEHPVPIDGSEGAYSPSVSPDGHWVAFSRGIGHGLLKIPISGGVPVQIGDSSGGWGEAWLADGSILYVRGPGTLTRIDPNGTRSTIWQAGRDSIVNLPTALPDSRGALFILCNGTFTDLYQMCHRRQELWVADLVHGGVRRLMSGIAEAWYVDPGLLVCVRTTGGAVVVPFDVRRMVVTGEAEPALDTVALDPDFSPMMTVTPSGTAVVLTRSADWNLSSQLLWVDRHGTIVGADSLGLGSINAVALSPDGRTAALDVSNGSDEDIYLHRVDRPVATRLTFGAHAAYYRPRWTPDGLSITLPRDSSVVIRRADNTGTARVVPVGVPTAEVAWNPDGRWLLVRTYDGHQKDILSLRPGVDRAPVELIADTGYDETAPAISPNGRWIAYESNESGKVEVYVRPFPDVGNGKWQVSTGGGVAPVWSHSGRELFYVRGAVLRSAAISAGGGFSVTGDAALFQLPPGVELQQSHATYDVARDDQRFLMIRGASWNGSDALRLSLIENWRTELRQRLAGQH